MTTNLKSIAGTDFDDLFEAGAGNQLLNIYAMDGQDVGQKYLNVSQGSQVSVNTGFQASDSADVKTKLCGKGTNTISYKIWQEYNKWGNYMIYITVSKMRVHHFHFLYSNENHQCIEQTAIYRT